MEQVEVGLQQWESWVTATHLPDTKPPRQLSMKPLANSSGWLVWIGGDFLRSLVPKRRKINSSIIIIRWYCSQQAALELYDQWTGGVFSPALKSESPSKYRVKCFWTTLKITLFLFIISFFEWLLSIPAFLTEMTPNFKLSYFPRRALIGTCFALATITEKTQVVTAVVGAAQFGESIGSL